MMAKKMSINELSLIQTRRALVNGLPAPDQAKTVAAMKLEQKENVKKQLQRLDIPMVCA